MKYCLVNQSLVKIYHRKKTPIKVIIFSTANVCTNLCAWQGFFQLLHNAYNGVNLWNKRKLDFQYAAVQGLMWWILEGNAKLLGGIVANEIAQIQAKKTAQYFVRAVWKTNSSIRFALFVF
jgi:hypothetical protein